jgi:hypothetical protein
MSHKVPGSNPASRTRGIPNWKQTYQNTVWTLKFSDLGVTTIPRRYWMTTLDAEEHT